jgi:hypothetical protein
MDLPVLSHLSLPPVRLLSAPVGAGLGVPYEPFCADVLSLVMHTFESSEIQPGTYASSPTASRDASLKFSRYSLRASDSKPLSIHLPQRVLMGHAQALSPLSDDR